LVVRGRHVHRVDYPWRANDTDAKTLTVAPGGTVSFSNPAGGDFHNVAFEGAQPSSCTGLPPGPRKDWQGECA
jgi:plastocyanin